MANVGLSNNVLGRLGQHKWDCEEVNEAQRKDTHAGLGWGLIRVRVRAVIKRSQGYPKCMSYVE